MRERRPNKRKIQGAETKKKLYDIAERLFEQYGFENVSVEDITHEAGITKGAFYVHYESKDALIGLLLEKYTTLADSQYQSYFETLPADMSATDKLLALTEQIAKVITEKMGQESITKVYQMMLVGSSGTEAVKGYNRKLYPLLHGVLEDGIKCGEFKNTLSVDELTRSLVMALRGLCVEWCIRYPDFDLIDESKKHVALLLEGIKSRDN